MLRFYFCLERNFGMNSENKWIQIFKEQKSAKMKLFCFHYAGGSAQNYFSWQAKLSPEIEVCAVQLPGRWDRITEKPHVRMQELIRELYPAILNTLGSIEKPYAFFGHSLGSLVAFELYRKLRRGGHTLPVHLFFSSKTAPHVPVPEPLMYKLSDRQFLEILVGKYSAIPKEILADPEMKEIVLRIMRADFELLETYEFLNEDKIKTPISIFGGKWDREVPLQDLEMWKEVSCGDFKIKLFDGDHFYLKPGESQLLEEIKLTIL